MSNIKHTPGTWHTKEGQIYPTETGKTIAVIPYFDEANEEEKANAMLIAKAPVMLSILYKEIEYLNLWITGLRQDQERMVIAMEQRIRLIEREIYEIENPS